VLEMTMKIIKYKLFLQSKSGEHYTGPAAQWGPSEIWKWHASDWKYNSGNQFEL